MNTCGHEIDINGTKYVKKDTIPNGNRCVVVVDRGWIFAGDVERKDGRILISNAVWVFNWSSVGFDGVLKDPKSNKVQLRKLEHVIDMPEDTEIFSVPVTVDWGL